MADGVDNDIPVTDTAASSTDGPAGTTATEALPSDQSSAGTAAPAVDDNQDEDTSAAPGRSAQAVDETQRPATSANPVENAEASDQGDSDESEDSDSDSEDSDSDSEDSEDRSDEDRSDEDQSDEDDGDDDDESDNPLDVEGEIAADYLEELLDIADLDGDIDTYVENGRAHVSVITESDVLVGADGEVLEALQELTRLAVITETGNRSRLMLDIAGYRERRRKALTDLATDAVQEAKSSGEPVRLAPMNPFERKIVHDVVAAAGLSSESEGEEPQRRVVIQPRG